MGRKSLAKERKDNPEKKLKWVLQLIPHFHRHGLKNFSMDEVAGILQKSKATIYKYFESREEILQIANEYIIEELMGFEEVLKDTSIPYPDRLMASIDFFLEKMSSISLNYLLDLQNMYPQLWESVAALQEYAAMALQEYYVIGIKAGYFNEIDPAILVQTDRLYFVAITDPLFLIKNGLSPQEALEGYFQLKFNGLLKR